MPLLLIRDDVTRTCAGAVVNTADEEPGQGRGISLAAGEELLSEACKRIGRCGQGEEELLYSSYMESMKLARERNRNALALPLIPAESRGCPKEKALRTAVSAIRDFLAENDMMIYLAVHDAGSLAVSRQLSARIEEYIDEHYIEDLPPMGNQSGERKAEGRRRSLFGLGRKRKENPAQPHLFPSAQPQKGGPDVPPAPAGASRAMQASSAEKTRMLDDMMLHMGETFSQMLLRLIDERGLTDPEVYHKANIDRKLFSKIRTNLYYSPTKKTVMAFAIALELSLDETKDLLQAAGYSLSPGSRFDVIISFFLENKIYDVFEINEMLFYYEQPILGG